MSSLSNPVEALADQLQQAFPSARIALDVPMNPKGVWFLDVQLNGHLVIVQWQVGRNFGISCAAEHHLGEGADELHKDLNETYARIVELLLSQSYTTPLASSKAGS